MVNSLQWSTILHLLNEVCKLKIIMSSSCMNGRFLHLVFLCEKCNKNTTINGEVCPGCRGTWVVIEMERVGSRHFGGQTIFQAPERAKSRPSWASSNFKQSIHECFDERTEDEQGNGPSGSPQIRGEGPQEFLTINSKDCRTLWEFVEDLHHANSSSRLRIIGYFLLG